MVGVGCDYVVCYGKGKVLGVMGFKGFKLIVYGGCEVWFLVEGGKGVFVINYVSLGVWVVVGGIGMVSVVNVDSYDVEGKIIFQVYQVLICKECYEELICYGIDGVVV